MPRDLFAPPPRDLFAVPAAVSESQLSKDTRAELSAMTQNPAKAEYDALPGWQKPLVAASDVVQLAADGATMGFGDKAVAAVRAPFTDKSYSQELEAQRRLTEAARQRGGSAGFAAELAGGLATPVAVAKKGVTLAGRFGTEALTGVKGLLARTGLMGAEGAGYGTVNAAGHDADLGEGAIAGSLGGAGGNVLGEGLSASVSKIAGLLAKKPARLSVDDLKSAGDAAYKRSEAAGVIINRDGMQKLGHDVVADFSEHGFLPANEPGAAAVLKELQKQVDGNVTLKGLDTLRKMAGNAYIPGNKSNNTLVGKIVKRIDELVASEDPSHMAGIDTHAGAEALREARTQWHRARKLETVEGLVDRGELNAGSTGSGGNVENATRQQIKRILTNDSMKRGFTKDELAAARRVTLGTPAQNLLRLAGKQAPSALNITAHMLGGAASGGATLPFSAAGLAAGLAAKKGAESITRANVKDFANLVARGGNRAATRAPKNAVQRLAETKRQAIARAIMAGIVNRTTGAQAPGQ